jgi:hypothetical protein
VTLLVSGLIVFLCIHIVPMNASLKRLLSADPGERLQARLAWHGSPRVAASIKLAIARMLEAVL